MSNSQPFFSVVIPVYNREEMISDTLESVFAQEYDDYEVIVVDDGSTDGTVEVVKSYGDRVTLLQQENKGPGAARNTGVQEAKGTYVAFLDSDDRWFPWTLLSYREAIKKHKPISFLGGALYPFTDESELSKVSKKKLKLSAFSDYLEAGWSGVFVGSGMAAVRREVFVSAGGFTEKNVNAEDHDFALKIGNKKGFVFIKNPPLIGLKRHKKRLSSVDDKTSEGISLIISRERNKKYPGKKERKKERLSIITRHVRSHSFDLAKSGKLKKSLKFYLDTISWHISLGRWKYIFGFPFVSLLKYYEKSE